MKDKALDADGIKVEREALALKLSNNSLTKKLKYYQDELTQSERRYEALLGSSKELSRRQVLKMKSRKTAAATAGAVLSDWHVGEVVDPTTVNDLNTFNIKIAEQRINRIFQRIVFFIETYRDVAAINELVLALLGDFITGYIHEELLESSDLSPTEAVIFLREHICSGIEFLLKEAGVKRITVPTAFGNHGRTTPRKKISTGYKNSYEWMLYKLLERDFRSNPRVEFQVSNSIHCWTEVQGYKIRSHHGDSILYQGGVGGLTIPVNKAIAQWNKSQRAYLDLFGHYHQFLPHWSNWICNSSLIGYNAWALFIKAEFQPPSQTFFVIDREHGLVECKPIFC
ncbi:MAG: hypothetical protein E6R03_03315 [Hyphomicrobiaceae bacterium]|nr:MAG: hypothetical protein E6R03_03315 [Hyphomicrobiaceae bacterium]